ncbi:MAG TPA: hypothetical protein DIC54_15245 [Pseudomonas sp.]|nr:hypothetical protein [Pseudomonas sp.]
MSAIIIPFPNRGRPEGWPDGEVGLALDGLADLLLAIGNRSPGPRVTLAKARDAALIAYREHAAIQQRGAFP